MALLWSQIVEVTRAEAKQSLLTLLDSVGFAATSWQEGSIALGCVEVSAEIWSQGSKYAVFLKNYGLNATSTGDGLTRFSDSHYDNQRALAVSAQRRITLACAVGEGPHSISLGSVVISNAGGYTVRNVAGLSVIYPATLSSGAPLELLFEAEVGGAASNSGAGTYTSLVTTLAGVTVTQDLSYVVGVDEESDARLQARNRTKWATLSQFEIIADAVENIALNASTGVAKVKGNYANPRGAGTFDVHIAGESTIAGGADVTAVQAAFNLRVFGATSCIVYASPAAPLSLVGNVYYDSNFTAAQAQASVEAAMLAFIKATPLGGYSFAPGPTNIVAKNDIEAAIKGATFNGQPVVKTVTLSGPASDVAVSSFDIVTVGSYAGLVYVPVVS